MHWSELTKKGEEFISETVNGKTIFIVKSGSRGGAVEISCEEDQVMEGRWSAGLKMSRIDLVRDGESWYCVVAGLTW